jgi:hypothetical protein
MEQGRRVAHAVNVRHRHLGASFNTQSAGRHRLRAPKGDVAHRTSQLLRLVDLGDVSFPARTGSHPRPLIPHVSVPQSSELYRTARIRHACQRPDDDVEDSRIGRAVRPCHEKYVCVELSTGSRQHSDARKTAG